MKKWKEELITGGKILTGVEIQRDIFQGDVLSPFLLAIAMMALNNMLRKCTRDYKFAKSWENINHLMYMDNIKVFRKNEKGLETQIETISIYSKDIGMEFGIEKCAMLIRKMWKDR